MERTDTAGGIFHQLSMTYLVAGAVCPGRDLLATRGMAAAENERHGPDRGRRECGLAAEVLALRKDLDCARFPRNRRSGRSLLVDGAQADVVWWENVGSDLN